MTASQIANKTKLLRGSVKYRLRKLGYDTGPGIKYPPDIWIEVSAFKHIEHPSRKINHTLDAEVYFFWLENKNNSTIDISEALNIPTNRVNYILDRIFKEKEITIESRLNYTTINQL